MSGGSMNYLYSKVLHCADFECDTPERRAFAAHLKLVAQALHDIEWVDSGDYGPGDENAAIRACLAVQPAVPLTDDEIWKLYFDLATADFDRSDRIDFARAIERAHNII